MKTKLFKKKKKNTNIVSHTRLNAQFRHSEKQNASHDCESNRGKNRTTSGYIYIYISEPCKGTNSRKISRAMKQALFIETGLV